jgi:hypothetical protein
VQPHPRGRGEAPPFLDWGGLSDDAVLELLAPHAEAIRSAETAVAVHIQVLRQRNVSWQRIGAALGMSKQAAWEKYRAEAEEG